LHFYLKMGNFAHLSHSGQIYLLWLNSFQVKAFPRRMSLSPHIQKSREIAGLPWLPTCERRLGSECALS
jgi:hypothetical protein